MVLKKVIKNEKIKNNNKLNIVPLRNMLMVPHVILPLLIGRKETIYSVERTLMKNTKIICLTQKNSKKTTKYPVPNQMYRIGAVCNILQVFRLPEGSLRILVEGVSKVKIKKMGKNKMGFYTAEYDILEYEESGKKNIELKAFIRSFKHFLIEYIKENPNIPEEVAHPLSNMKKAQDCFYYALANIEIKVEQKQKLFNIENIFEAMQEILKIINKEIKIFKLERQIDKKVNTSLNKMQKNYYLREQLKAIQKELGEEEEDEGDIDSLKKRLQKLKLTKEAKKIADTEMQKLSRLPSYSQEYIVSYNYLMWIIDLPWESAKVKNFKLIEAKKILDDAHYGLKKVKDIILEYLALVKFTKKNMGKILCFVGPPGVGKTSLGKSIAKALGRKFVRLSLGGVRDEAEIRGGTEEHMSVQCQE